VGGVETYNDIMQPDATGRGEENKPGLMEA